MLTLKVKGAKCQNAYFGLKFRFYLDTNFINSYLGICRMWTKNGCCKSTYIKCCFHYVEVFLKIFFWKIYFRNIWKIKNIWSIFKEIAKAAIFWCSNLASFPNSNISPIIAILYPCCFSKLTNAALILEGFAL